MKSEKSIGKSRKARLNQARRYAKALGTFLSEYEDTPHFEPIQDATFWGNIREFAQKIDKCVHEANAYNNCMLDDGETSDPETYALSELGENILKGKQ